MKEIDDGTNSKPYIKWIVASVIAVVIAFAVGFGEQSLWGVKFPFLRLACDGCFVSGVLFLSFGGLSFISVHGGFDAISYGFYMLKSRFLHPNPEYREQAYYDYVTAKKKNRKAMSVLYLIIIGAVLIAASIIMLPFVPDFDPAFL